jgi:uncharacterized RDD family membrane protein YckC
MALLQVKTSFNIDLQFETAPFHLRFFAWILDFIFLILFWSVMSYLLNSTFSIEHASEFGLTELFLVTPFILYHFLFELLCNGQSPGKMIFKIKVVALNGQSAMVSQYLLRWLLRFVDFGVLWGFVFFISGSLFLGSVLMIGSIISFIIFVITPYNQRIGDIAAGTAIVLKKLPYKLSDTIFQELDTRLYQVTFPDVMRLSDKDINIIDNIVKQHYKSNIHQYVETVSTKIKTVLHIETDMDHELFLETLLRDYNYLSRK